MSTTLQLIGAAMVIIGAFFISAAVGFIVGGALVTLIGLSLGR